MLFIDVLIFLVSIPVGFLIAGLANDELKQGMKWFKNLMIVSVLGVAGGLFFNLGYLAWTFGFIGIVSGVSLWKN
jgi:hypothetical protein